MRYHTWTDRGQASLRNDQICPRATADLVLGRWPASNFKIVWRENRNYETFARPHSLFFFFFGVVVVVVLFVVVIFEKRG